jgi:hypothetical protein
MSHGVASPLVGAYLAPSANLARVSIPGKGANITTREVASLPIGRDGTYPDDSRTVGTTTLHATSFASRRPRRVSTARPPETVTSS